MFEKSNNDCVQNSVQSDPRSWNYQRVYNCPNLNWRKVLVHFFLPLLVLVCLWIVIDQIIDFKISNFVFCFFCILYFCFGLKRILVFGVQLYQNFAPISIRSMCRFEPSCSQYMIICLQKYGTVRGLYKGIKRINRCKHGDGGYDEP